MKKLRELQLTDHWMFQEVMSDPQICRIVLEKILEQEIEAITLINIEQVIHDYVETKGIRIDLYAKSQTGAIYDVELQVQEERLPERSRFYQGALDLSQLKPGKHYGQLKSTYVIFICCFDPGGRGRYKYHYGTYCRDERELELQDGLHRIFLNTRGYRNDVDEELQEFLKYVEDSSHEMAARCQGELVKRVHEKVEEIRANQAKESEYMLLSMQLLDAKEEGRMLGKADGIRISVMKMHEAGFSEEEIAKIMDLPVEQVQEWQRAADEMLV